MSIKTRNRNRLLGTIGLVLLGLAFVFVACFAVIKHDEALSNFSMRYTLVANTKFIYGLSSLAGVLCLFSFYGALQNLKKIE